MRREVTPKNILMIGPTGVGKTEIARRLATLAGAPFVKVEATKYTEVGYVGRDVESMVRDLAEAAVRMVSEERRIDVKDAADEAAVERVVDLLHPETRAPEPASVNPFAADAGLDVRQRFRERNRSGQTAAATRTIPGDEAAQVRATARADVERGFFDVRLVEIEVEEAAQLPIGMMGGDMGQGGDMSEMLGGLLPKKRVKKKVTVAEARRIFAQQEADKLIDRTRSSARRCGAPRTTASSSSTRSTRLPAAKGSAAPTFRARACSATSCRSSKGARCRRSTDRSRPTTCCSSPPVRFTSRSRPI